MERRRAELNQYLHGIAKQLPASARYRTTVFLGGTRPPRSSGGIAEDPDMIGMRNMAHGLVHILSATSPRRRPFGCAPSLWFIPP